MSRPSRTLIGTITDRAAATWRHPITRNNYGDWERHWIAEGKQWALELETAGLPETAATVSQHVADAERFANWATR